MKPMIAMFAFCLALRGQQPMEVVAKYAMELDVIELTLDAAGRFRPQDVAIRNARLVDTAAGRVIPGSAIVVRGGRIAQAGPGVSLPAGMPVIDAGGAFVAPGLADMHVHQLTTAAHHLLHLTQGITTVRDMSGFPWMLEWRRQAEAGEMLFPRMLVAGHILNAAPMGMYATVLRSTAEGRAEVQRQKALGYEYIKVHNAVPGVLYDAIAAEARAQGLWLVGHVPHGITVAHAIRNGHRTMEHLKGYLDDRTLEISQEDWAQATKGVDIWIVPTLSATRQFLRGDAAKKILESEQPLYLSPFDRERWKQAAISEVRPVHAAQAGKMREIVRRLLPVHDGFVAGTDSGGGYVFALSGFALHDELESLREAGLTNAQTLRAATVRAAEAAGRTGLFGEIREGASADLVLVKRSPLEDIGALRSPRGVMVRGRWLGERDLEMLRSRLRQIFAGKPPYAGNGALLTEALAEKLVARAEGVRRRGYVFPHHHIEEWADALEKLGRTAEAGKIRALRLAR
ncbi:MAG: amidohydrolase family protein [Bryobacteraceae bacterium]|nr:amidohydrolase family protein [Bryobacteraceae bacterium]